MTDFQLKPLILLLATKPRLGMQAVLDLRLGNREIILLAALVAVLTGICGYVSVLIAPPIEGAVVPSPLGYVFVGAVNIILSSFVFFWAGRAVEGSGDFASVAQSMIVHQAFMNLLPIWAAIFAVFVPGLFGVSIIIAFVYVMYLMAGFIAQAHKLRSTGTAVFLIVGVIAVMSAILIFLISLFGISPA